MADWKPLKLDRRWDMRWDARESEEAICRADDQAERARANLDRAIQCVAQAAEQYTSALSWCSSARTFGAKHLPVIPDPPAAVLGDQQEPSDGR